jgi:hypothetical protein
MVGRLGRFVNGDLLRRLIVLPFWRWFVIPAVLASKASEAECDRREACRTDMGDGNIPLARRHGLG